MGKLIAAAVATIAIGYCGKKEFEIDHLYGTGLTWTPDDIHMVPATAAAKMLQHPDVFFDATEMVSAAGLDAANTTTTDPAAGNTITTTENTTTTIDDPDKTEDQDQDLDTTQLAPLVTLETMTKSDLVAYAHRHFGVELPASHNKAELIEEVRTLMGKRSA